MIRFPRLIENHAQMLALADALDQVIHFSDEQKTALNAQFRQMALERQQVINADHPLVQEFWEADVYKRQALRHVMLSQAHPKAILNCRLFHFPIFVP